MSHFVASRSPAQCRSQNQKMYKRFKTITRIVNELKKETGEENFSEAYQRLCKDPLIKFVTEMEIKSLPSREETKEEKKASVEVAVQTEAPEGPCLTANERWMF